MAADPHNKSLRQLQIRDYLWEAFEQMSQELDCTLDYLVNESMRQYARSRDRGGPLAEVPEQPESLSQRGMPQGYPQRGGMQGGMQGGMPGAPPRMGPPGMPPQPNAAMRQTAGPPMGGPMQGGRPGGLPGMQQNPGGGMPGAPPGRLPSMSQGGMPGMPPRPGGGMPGAPPPRPGPPGMQGGGMPGLPQRPGPPAAPPPRMGPGVGRTLIAIYDGQQYPVTKEEFIIGRGQKTSDLTIRDSNVSRRHAAVVLYNNQHWIMDQQSTNGVEFNGTKVERKVIEDGDVFRICDHEIQFLYR